MTNRISVLVLLTLVPLACIADSRDDYFREKGSSASTIKRKSGHLMDWSRKLAARGSALPTELYPMISRGRLARKSDGRDKLRSFSKSLDGYAQELVILQDSPKMLGSGRFGRIRSNRVGDSIRIDQTYTVGRKLTVGAGILVAKHWQHDIRLQGLNERLANYVTAETDNPDVRLNIMGVAHRGVHGSPYGLIELPYVEIVAGELVPGDHITIHYGAGPQKFRLPQIPVKKLTLPLYLRLKRSGHFFTIPVKSFSVVAGAPEKILVSTPSIVKPNQSFELTVRAQDRYGNLSEGIVPALEVVIDGIFQHRIQSSSNPVSSIGGLSFTDEGLHRITVRSGGGGLFGDSNPLLVDSNIGLKIMWANLHAHSNRSDGMQSPGMLKKEAQGEFDLILMADHDNYVPVMSGRDMREVSRPLASGGHRVMIPGGTPIVIALPEIPMDHRLPGRPTLVEIKSGPSDHEWIGAHFAGLGYRIGFAGSPTSHQPRHTVRAAKTALLLKEGDNWQQAVAARRTYVTSGPKSILLTKVNDAYPGSRARLTNQRVITGEVFATSGIETIELIRNGKVINRQAMKSSDSEDLLVKITFRSASRPLAPGFDLPRNGREWLGYLRITGASIKSLTAPGFDRDAKSAIAINPDDTGRVDFITWTHGNEQSFELTLDETSDEKISFEMNIRGGFEDVALLPLARDPSATPSARQVLSIDEMIGDGATREISVNGYVDSISYQIVSRQRTKHQAYTFVDTRISSPGDYYYVRVRQSGDHTLWSSPVYVGGFDIE